MRRGEALWRKGEPASRLVLVARGMVALFAAPQTGRELILALHAPVEGVDEPAVLSGVDHACDAFAFSATTVALSLPREALLGALRDDGAASLAYAQLLARRHREVERRLCFATLAVEQRLAQLLVELAERFGDELDDGALMIPLRLTRGQLASMVGTTVESVIRAFSRWSRAGLVSTGENGIVVRDPAALEREVDLTPEREPRAVARGA